MLLQNKIKFKDIEIIPPPDLFDYRSCLCLNGYKEIIQGVIEIRKREWGDTQTYIGITRSGWGLLILGWK